MVSCENVTIAFWKILFPKIRILAPNATLHALKLIETPRNFVEYFGEGQ
jgi:6-pyruvoyltetrahydropterin/6-carboxytetrahydropterin synthase